MQQREGYEDQLSRSTTVGAISQEPTRRAAFLVRLCVYTARTLLWWSIKSLEERLPRHEPADFRMCAQSR
jgi:hypothetical protein